MKRMLMVIVVAVCLLPNASRAQGGLLIGAGLGQDMRLRQPSFGIGFAGVRTLSLGSEVEAYIAAEGIASNSEFDNALGGSLIVAAPFKKDGKVFLLFDIGWLFWKPDDGPSFGAGLAWQATDPIGLYGFGRTSEVDRYWQKFAYAGLYVNLFGKGNP